jgi:molybdopterin biosynthesis enzyme
MTQRLPPSLTPLDSALAAWLRGLGPVVPSDLPLADAAGCIAADAPPVPAYPARDVASVDGWAFRANDLVGASAYSPLSLSAGPAWVEAGEPLPEGCDCVLDADAVDVSSPLAQVLAEGVPGQGVRRASSDIDGKAPIIVPGRRIDPAALLLARLSRLESLSVRRPRLRIVDLPGAEATAQLIADIARAEGLHVTVQSAGLRDQAAIAAALDASACDLLLTIGGSGVGRTDAAVTALARCGAVIAHGLALQPGRTAALGRLGAVPAAVLPGSPDHALAAWLVLVSPLVERLTARQPRRQMSLPLARKIASQVGIAELVLLVQDGPAWMPLATGEWPLHAVMRADAWLIIPASQEGFAAGTPVDASLMRE